MAALEVLIKAGCDLNAEAGDCVCTFSTPALVASGKARSLLIDDSLPVNWDENAARMKGLAPAQAAEMHGYLEALKLLIKAGCDVNAGFNDGRQLVYEAAECGWTEVLKLLIEAGCNVDTIVAYRERTPSHVAAQNDQAAALRLLIEAGCDFDEADRGGNRPAHSAIQTGSLAALKVLIEAGCDLDAEGENGMTLAKEAAMSGEAAALELLIEAGCDFDSDGNGDRPLKWAAKRGYVGCVRALTRAGATLVADGETVDLDELQKNAALEKAPELECSEEIMTRAKQGNEATATYDEGCARVHYILRKVRLAGSWRSYMIEERRSLATLMALWKRQRHADPPRYMTRSAASKLPRGDCRAPSHAGAPLDVAVWARVFELPLDVAVPILRFYTDLAL